MRRLETLVDGDLWDKPDKGVANYCLLKSKLQIENIIEEIK